MAGALVSYPHHECPRSEENSHNKHKKAQKEESLVWSAAIHAAFVSCLPSAFSLCLFVLFVANPLLCLRTGSR
jgi:hypothetical protein